MTSPKLFKTIQTELNAWLFNKASIIDSLEKGSFLRAQCKRRADRNHVTSLRGNIKSDSEREHRLAYAQFINNDLINKVEESNGCLSLNTSQMFINKNYRSSNPTLNAQRLELASNAILLKIEKAVDPIPNTAVCWGRLLIEGESAKLLHLNPHNKTQKISVSLAVLNAALTRQYTHIFTLRQTARPPITNPGFVNERMFMLIKLIAENEQDLTP